MKTAEVDLINKMLNPKYISTLNKSDCRIAVQNQQAVVNSKFTTGKIDLQCNDNEDYWFHDIVSLT